MNRYIQWKCACGIEVDINKYQSIIQSFLAGTDIAIILFDITDRESFKNIETYWIEMITANSNIDLTYFVLIGHKDDQKWKREVTFTEASMLAEKYNLWYTEVSSLNSGRVLQIVDIFLLRYFEDKSIYYKRKPEPNSKCNIQ